MKIRLFGGPSDGTIHADTHLPHAVYTQLPPPHATVASYATAHIDVAAIPNTPIHRYDVLPFLGIARAIGIAVAVYSPDMSSRSARAYQRAVRWIRSEAWRELNALSVERSVLNSKIDRLQDALRDSDSDYRPDLRPIAA